MKDQHPANEDVYLAAGGTNCILVRLRDKTATTPAFIQIAKVNENVRKGICPEILEAAPIKAYLDAQVPGVTPEGSTSGTRPGVIPVSSNLTIHQ